MPKTIDIENIISLATRLQDARSEVKRLESEFTLLISPARRVQRVPKEIKDKNQKPVRQKDRILELFNKSEGPVRYTVIQKSLGVSKSCILDNLKSLLREKRIIKKGRGLYQKT